MERETPAYLAGARVPAYLAADRALSFQTCWFASTPMAWNVRAETIGLNAGL